MSILLDAVTKSKQQQSDVIDPALSPRQQYALRYQKNSLPLKIGLFLIAIVIAVICAWWFAKVQSTDKSQVVAQKQADPVKIPLKQEQRPKPVAPQKLEQSRASDVKLAGKSALPIAQVYSGSNYQTPEQTPMNKSEPIESPEPSAQPQMSKPSDLNSDSLNQQPIILGRQPSEDELAIIHSHVQKNTAPNPQPKSLTEQQQQLSLETLKRKIAAAASDVGLKTKEQQQRDELVKEIDTQLRNTEYRKSVQSSAKNDSMMQGLPRSKYSGVPSYGELPAGVQLQVPEFNIGAHMYSTNPSQRRLSVNGQELKEGDKIKGKLKILEIRPRDVVLEVAGEKFKVPAI